MAFFEPCLTLQKKQELTAREPNDRHRLQTLRTWHDGTLFIDDFHRLEHELYQDIADYLKYLADNDITSKKLVIAGIPYCGQSLIGLAPDLATRITIMKWRKVKDELVREMIEKGERALNITFAQKEDIILAANGSLNVAQILCSSICKLARIIETQKQPKVVDRKIEDAIAKAMDILYPKFHESLIGFAAMGDPTDRTCLELLEELKHSTDGLVSLPMFKMSKPELAHGIERFLNERWIEKFYQAHRHGNKYLFFQHIGHALVAEDPQFFFYLKKLSYSQMEKEAGKVKVTRREKQKVFICYSYDDSEWFERLHIHLSRAEDWGIIDSWNENDITSGTREQEELASAIESSAVAVILISEKFLITSGFVYEHHLPVHLTRAKARGTTILPLIVTPCLLKDSGLEAFSPVTPSNKSLVEMTLPQQDRILVNLAATIQKVLSMGKD